MHKKYILFFPLRQSEHEGDRMKTREPPLLLNQYANYVK